jgi:putative endonuclease
LYRNFRAPGGGEIDVVCRHGEVLCFVEVKTRTSEKYGRPAMAVDLPKKMLMLRGASHWLRLLGWPEIAWRYDIVEVMLVVGGPPDVHWIQGAFDTTAVRREWAARKRRLD